MSGISATTVFADTSLSTATPAASLLTCYPPLIGLEEALLVIKEAAFLLSCIGARFTFHERNSRVIAWEREVLTLRCLVVLTNPPIYTERPEQPPEQLKQLTEQLEQLPEQPEQLSEKLEQLPDHPEQLQNNAQNNVNKTRTTRTTP